MLRFTRFPILLSIASLFIFFSVASAQTPRQDSRPRTASVSGRVTVAGRPAVNAKVAVTEVKDISATGNQDFLMDLMGSGAGEDYVALTDAEGRYRATNLPEGKFKAQALMGSHVRERPSLNESLIESFSLYEGESRENVDFALVRGGVITGRVTDADGRPLIERAVSLQGVDEQGRKTFALGSQNPMSLMMGISRSQTDDRGVYRIFGLRAGRYVVSAGGESDIFSGAAGAYPRAWHPDAADENQAKVVEVTSGGEVTGVDIRLGAAKKVYEASGRVVDDETGKPIAGAGVTCVKVGADDGETGFGGIHRNAKTDEQGNFRFAGLTPGQYELRLADYESNLMDSGGNYYSEGAEFEIHGGDAAGVEVADGIVVTGREEIAGVRIVFRKGSGKIRGQVQVTGGAMPDGWRMIVTTRGEKTVGGFNPPARNAEVDGKGRFVIEEVLPGEYELMLSAQPVINPNSPPQPVQNMPAPVTQKVVVTKGQEAQVTLTLDLRKKNQEEK